MSAACVPQKFRCSLPGERDSPHDATIMSKSKLSSLFWYCDVSTVLTLTSMPSRCRLFLNGRTIRSKAGWTRRISNFMASPVFVFTSCPFVTFHPASASSLNAFLRPSRISPEPSVFGGS